jgi:site-specific DNA-methyltransferase (adenine-specific)/modification methylase
MEPVVVRLSDSVTIINADCRDVLPVECDAVVTDPPYYVKGAMISGGGDGWMPGKRKEVMCWNDGQYGQVLQLAYAAPLVAIWGGNYHALPVSRGWLVWHKPDAVATMASAELCWTNQNRNTKQMSWSIAATNAERVGHPTQKPVRVMAWTFEQMGVPEGASVLDPYMGSGTTGIACIRTGRKFIGIEKDASYFEIARKRLENELRQGLLPLTYDSGNDQTSCKVEGEQ